MFSARSWLRMAHGGGVAALVLMLMILVVHRLDAQPAAANSPHMEPTVTRVIPIQYRDAVELAAILRPHLGTCAVVTADPHTNALIITGKPSCLRFQYKQERARGADPSPRGRQLE